MDKRNAPPVDEDDPSSQAVEVVPEKLDLQKKSPEWPGTEDARIRVHGG